MSSLTWVMTTDWELCSHEENSSKMILNCVLLLFFM